MLQWRELPVCMDYTATSDELADALGGRRGDDRIARSRRDGHLVEAELRQHTCAELYVARRPR